MYYTINRRAPSVRLGETTQTRDFAQTQMIFGLPAESFIRIAAPLFTGAISAVGLIYSIQGRHRAATTVALTGVLLSSFVAAGQALAVEESRTREAPGG